MKFRALQKSIWVLEKSWKSPGNLFLKKGTNPVYTLALWGGYELELTNHSAYKSLNIL